MKLPNNVKFADHVPRKGGASCATCKFLSKDRKHCNNRFYIDWRGDTTLGDVAEEWCCCAYKEK